jgi:anhydro-N-acetylmuramic acid kinase
MQSMLVLGVMSGTSLDGVDYALCDITDRRVSLRALWHAPYPRPWKERLHRAARGDCSGHELAQWHHDLGRFYSAHAGLAKGRLRPALVGLHGQTIFHHPDRQSPATFQLGEPAWLARALGAPVVSNFRAGDLAAGGQGAPLATLFHLRAFARRGAHVCVNNLGGISNVTSLDWRRGARPRVRAFDTGPANVLLDLAMRHYSGGRRELDRDGAWAARGRVCEPLLARWLKHPYFRQPPPKSTGRELFGETFFRGALKAMRAAQLTKFDALATLTAFTARSLVLNYEWHLPSMPDRVVLAGGGAANPALTNAIALQLELFDLGIEILRADELGWPLASVEPAAFALLAWQRWRGLPGNLPETTGARAAVPLGQITAP